MFKNELVLDPFKDSLGESENWIQLSGRTLQICRVDETASETKISIGNYVYRFSNAYLSMLTKEEFAERFRKICRVKNLSDKDLKSVNSTRVVDICLRQFETVETFFNQKIPKQILSKAASFFYAHYFLPVERLSEKDGRLIVGNGEKTYRLKKEDFQAFLGIVVLSAPERPLER